MSVWLPLGLPQHRERFMAPAHLPLVLKGLKPKQQQLSGLNLMKSLQVTNGETVDDDLGIDLSSDDEK